MGGIFTIIFSLSKCGVRHLCHFHFLASWPFLFCNCWIPGCALFAHYVLVYPYPCLWSPSFISVILRERLVCECLSVSHSALLLFTCLLLQGSDGANIVVLPFVTPLLLPGVLDFLVLVLVVLWVHFRFLCSSGTDKQIIFIPASCQSLFWSAFPDALLKEVFNCGTSCATETGSVVLLPPHTSYPQWTMAASPVFTLNWQRRTE